MLTKTKNLTNLKLLGILLATAVALTSPRLVWADEGEAGDKNSSHQEGNWHHGQGEHMMFKVLNLSEDQEKLLKDNHQKQKEAMKVIFGQMKANREAFDAEIVKATPDMNQINTIQVQFKSIQSQMADNQLNTFLAIKKILTPEQFAGYMALKKERELMMHDGHNKFGHKDGFDKDGDKHWGDRADKDHDPDDKD